MTAVQAFNQGVHYFTITTMSRPYRFLTRRSTMIPVCEAYYGRAACKHAQKRLDASLSDLNEAVRVKPLLGCLFASGRGVLRIGTLDAALPILITCFRSAPTTPRRSWAAVSWR